MPQIIDRAYLSIDGRDFDARSIDWTLAIDGADVSKTMNKRNRAKSHKGGIATFELNCEIPLPEGDHDVDFASYALNRTLFTATIEYADGTSRNFYDCVITNVSEAPSSGDETITKLAIKALDYGKN